MPPDRHGDAQSRTPAPPSRRPRRRVAGLGRRPWRSTGSGGEEARARASRAAAAGRALRDQPPARLASAPARRRSRRSRPSGADDALLAILGKLDSYRGESRFTTWAYKFALLEAAVKLRRRAWQGREIPIEPEHWAVLAGSGTRPTEAPRAASSWARSPRRSRPSFRRISARSWWRSPLNGVPIDVLAERLNTTRGALYKTIHDARKKLRAHLADAGSSSATPDRREMTHEREAKRRSCSGALLGPEGPELSCEECFEQLDRYVELELERRRRRRRACPGMRAHLQGCPACDEDHHSLRALVEPSDVRDRRRSVAKQATTFRKETHHMNAIAATLRPIPFPSLTRLRRRPRRPGLHPAADRLRRRCRS